MSDIWCRYRGREAGAVGGMAPDYWTVFNRQEGRGRRRPRWLRRGGATQPLLARLFAEGDRFYNGHEGGFPAVARSARLPTRWTGWPAAVSSGITTFPALLFEPDEPAKCAPRRTSPPWRAAVEALRRVGRKDIEVNAPGTSSSAGCCRPWPTTARRSASQGHGLTGTPLHPAACRPRPARYGRPPSYVSEVSHINMPGRAYCFGGGLYIDPVFPLPI